MGHVAAAGTIDQIDALLLETPRQRHRILRRPAAVDPVRRRNPPGQRQVFRPRGPDGPRHFQRETDAVFKRTTVRVVALVGQRRQKLVPEIAVRAVQFQPAVARRQRPLRRRRGTPPPPRRSPRPGQRVRRTLALPERQRARPDRLPAALVVRHLAAAFPGTPGARLAPGVRELHTPGTAPCASMNRLIRASGSICASFHSPASCGVMRPSAVTAVASQITSAAPPTAREPRCTRCQSFACPSPDEYMHIGDTPMRLRRVTSLSRNSLNK